MKQSISILSVLTFVLAFSGSVFAQQTITASAEVQSTITLSTPAADDGSVNFGTIQADATPVLDPTGANTADVGGSSSIAKIEVSGAQANEQLYVSWNKSTYTLENSASATMTFTPAVYANSSDNNSGAQQITSGSAGSNTETSSTGDLYIYIGGDLGTLTGQDTGTYSTTNAGDDLEFTVNYN